MAAKKKPKKSTEPVSTLRAVWNKKSIGKGAPEAVVGAYFSTVFRVTNNRVGWGNFSSHYAYEDYPTLDPNDILTNASEIYVESGETKVVIGDTFLVAKGRNHSLLIKIDNWSDETLIVDFHKTSKLTIGSLYSKIEYFIERNSLDSTIYITRQHPTPISVSDRREWSLVKSNSGKTGWDLDEDARFHATYLGAGMPELLLHAYINSPHFTWAVGRDDSQIFIEKHKQKLALRPAARKKKK